MSYITCLQLINSWFCSPRPQLLHGLVPGPVHRAIAHYRLSTQLLLQSSVVPNLSHWHLFLPYICNTLFKMRVPTISSQQWVGWVPLISAGGVPLKKKTEHNFIGPPPQKHVLVGMPLRGNEWGGGWCWAQTSILPLLTLPSGKPIHFRGWLFHQQWILIYLCSVRQKWTRRGQSSRLGKESTYSSK